MIRSRSFGRSMKRRRRSSSPMSGFSIFGVISTLRNVSSFQRAHARLCSSMDSGVGRSGGRPGPLEIASFHTLRSVIGLRPAAAFMWHNVSGRRFFVNQGCPGRLPPTRSRTRPRRVSALCRTGRGRIGLRARQAWPDTVRGRSGVSTGDFSLFRAAAPFIASTRRRPPGAQPYSRLRFTTGSPLRPWRPP